MYRKESKGKTMTFVVSETNWSDEATGEPVVTVRNNTIVGPSPAVEGKRPWVSANCPSTTWR